MRVTRAVGLRLRKIGYRGFTKEIKRSRRLSGSSLKRKSINSIHSNLKSTRSPEQSHAAGPPSMSWLIILRAARKRSFSRSS